MRVQPYGLLFSTGDTWADFNENASDHDVVPKLDEASACLSSGFVWVTTMACIIAVAM